MKKITPLILVLLIVLTFTGCGQETATEKVLVKENIYVFSDGETVSTWKFPNDRKLIFQLSNGTELLATRTFGPKDNFNENGINFSDLGQETQDNISMFYEQLGEAYNLQEYLEKAYKELKSLKSEFQCYYIEQETYCSAINENEVTCITTFSIPLGNGAYESSTITHTFDVHTGEHIQQINAEN